jgi:hypothetical protein
VERKEKYHKRIEEKNSQETLLVNTYPYKAYSLNLFKSVSSKQQGERIDYETTKQVPVR